jgi:hypothetical protein
LKKDPAGASTAFTKKPWCFEDSIRTYCVAIIATFAFYDGVGLKLLYQPIGVQIINTPDEIFNLPKVIHIANRAQVSAFRLTMSSTLSITLAAGSSGTHGTRNGNRAGDCWCAQIMNTPNEKDTFNDKTHNKYKVLRK